MQGISKAAITIVTEDETKAPAQNGLPLKKKSKSSLNLLKATLYLLRHKSKSSKNPKSKSIQADVASKFSWKGLVGSMRPMHLQGNQTPRSKPPNLPKPDQQLPGGGYIEEAKIPYQMEGGSPSPSDITSYGSPSDLNSYPSTSDLSSYASLSDMSQYQSPSHPQLRSVKSCEEVIPGMFWYGVDDDDDDLKKDGDEMIDSRAEEFIAQFYEQMRIQNQS